MTDGRRTGTDGQRFLLRGVFGGSTEVNPGVVSGVELFNPHIYLDKLCHITDS